MDPLVLARGSRHRHGVVEDLAGDMGLPHLVLGSPQLVCRDDRSQIVDGGVLQLLADDLDLVGELEGAEPEP